MKYYPILQEWNEIVPQRDVIKQYRLVEYSINRYAIVDVTQRYC